MRSWLKIGDLFIQKKHKIQHIFGVQVIQGGSPLDYEPKCLQMDLLGERVCTSLEFRIVSFLSRLFMMHCRHCKVHHTYTDSNVFLSFRAIQLIGHPIWASSLHGDLACCVVFEQENYMQQTPCWPICQFYLLVWLMVWLIERCALGFPSATLWLDWKVRGFKFLWTSSSSKFPLFQVSGSKAKSIPKENIHKCFWQQT